MLANTLDSGYESMDGPVTTALPVIFLGPTLSQKTARQIFDADYRPPAKKGDLLRLATRAEITMVGLIDGVFLQDYPPTPIEVYQLVKRQNIFVAGAASLGALRAVELEKYGMFGIGKVFELYKKGTICADDEIAVTFGQDDYALQSEAMIDIRYNLFLAYKKSAISKNAKNAIAKVAKGIYFPDRNYEHILDKAKKRYPNLAPEIESFRIYVAENRKSLKEIDAINLIKYFKMRYLR